MEPCTVLGWSPDPEGEGAILGASLVLCEVEIFSVNQSYSVVGSSNVAFCGQYCGNLCCHITLQNFLRWHIV